MQKQLTTRDWILYGLLSLLVLLLFLLMSQIDRQWLKLAAMESALSEQSKDMRELRSFIAAGKVQAASTDNAKAIQEVAPAFERAQAASRLPDYALGDWNVEPLETNIKTLTPLIAGDAYAVGIQSFVQESLLIRNPETLEWEGLIAKSWKVSDDGLVISFQLREDVTFSDGEPLTAEDVVFTFDFTMNEAIQAPRDRAYLQKIKEVKANGKYEVVFTFKEPYFMAMSLAGGNAILPKHFYEGYLKDPQKFNQSKGLLLGSGPYKLIDPLYWSPDKGNVELVRNERYWGDVQPAYNRLLWKIIQNDSARLTTYRNGEIDSYTARPVEYQGLKNDGQIMAKSQLFEYMSLGRGYKYITWNQERGGKPTRFADKRVRQALTYLTDVGRINDEVYYGYAEPAVSPFGNNSKQHDRNLQPYKFNLEKAKQLLKEAGYADRNGDGLLEDSAGQPFEFKLIYTQSVEDYKRLVLLLKDTYARAGVKLIPSPQEFPVLVESLDKKDFDAGMLGWGGGLETDLYQIFHSSQALNKGDNRNSYKNPELDKLIEQARSTVDESKRMPLWRQAEHIIYEDQPYTFLSRTKELLFVDKRIANVQMTKTGLNLGNLPMENYVPVEKQKYTQ